MGLLWDEYIRNREVDLSGGRLEVLRRHYINKEFFEFNSLLLEKELESSEISYLKMRELARLCLDGLKVDELSPGAYDTFRAHSDSALKALTNGTPLEGYR